MTPFGSLIPASNEREGSKTHRPQKYPASANVPEMNHIHRISSETCHFYLFNLLALK
jgi:hypothetical protein